MCSHVKNNLQPVTVSHLRAPLAAMVRGRHLSAAALPSYLLAGAQKQGTHVGQGAHVGVYTPMTTICNQQLLQLFTSAER